MAELIDKERYQNTIFFPVGETCVVGKDDERFQNYMKDFEFLLMNKRKKV